MHTPHLAALARSGVSFSKAFAVYAGVFPIAAYVDDRPDSFPAWCQDWLMPVDSYGAKSRRFLDGHQTWSELLAQAGYTLGLAGKWHMGHDDRPHAGFSYWATVPGGGGPYTDPTFFKNGETVPMKGFKTDLVGDAALEFLDSRAGISNPFALYMPLYAPHTPYNYQPDVYREPYKGSDFPCFPRLSKIRAKTPPRGPSRQHGQHARLFGAHHRRGRATRPGRRKLKKMGLRGHRDRFHRGSRLVRGPSRRWGKGNGTWPFNMYDNAIGVP